MKNILVFINPRSRKGRDHREFVLQWLKDHDLRVLNEDTGPSVEEMRNLMEKHQGTADLVVIGGGDGSLREALPGLLHTRLPLLYLPIGTLNNLAKALQLPLEVEESLELILKNAVKEIEIGAANGIPFHTVVGLGLSTQVNRFVRADLKRWLGAFAFLWTGLNIVSRMRPFHLSIEVDGKRHTGRSWQVTICNGVYYGSGLKIDPDAEMTDHLLRGQSVETEKWWYALRFLPHLLFRGNERYKDLEIFSGREIVLKTKQRMNVDLDGDLKTKTPLHLQILPQKLKILVPPNI
jgi:YegS/Rv2252/BmrU family lipid kinase